MFATIFSSVSARPHRAAIYLAAAFLLMLLSLGIIAQALDAPATHAPQTAPFGMVATADELADSGDWLDFDLAIPFCLLLVVPVVRKGFFAARRNFSSFVPLLDTPPPLRLA